jgi:two-component system sensor histidine kinase/response regulator
MDDYVAKPISPLAVAQVLEHWLDVVRQRAAAGPAASVTGTGGGLEVAPSAAVWDRAALLARAMDAPDLAASIVAAFRAELPEEFAALDQALAAADRVLVERLVHSLKSAAANLGAEPLRAQAAAAEAAARADRLDTVHAALPALRAAADRLCQALDAAPFHPETAVDQLAEPSSR